MTFLLNPFISFGGEIIFQVKTDNLGVSNSTSFLMPLRQTSGTYDYTVEWGDGTVESFTGSTNPTHDYGVAGTYTVRVTGTFTGNFYFNNSNDRRKIISLSKISLPAISALRAFFGCSSLTTLNLSNWDASNVSNFTVFAHSCSSLTTLNLSNLDTSNASAFNEFIRECVSLTTLDISSWDLGKASNFSSFALSSGLTNFIVGNAFDNTPCTNFSGAFLNCKLNQTSVDAILVSINTAGTSNGTLTINGGTNATPSATGQAATDALRARGWTVTLNGY
jgi:surface protein